MHGCGGTALLLLLARLGVVMLSAASLATANDAQRREDAVPPGAQRITFKPPQMDEEETDSLTLPDAYRCDACAAIAYQIETQFKKAEANKSSKRLRRLSEVEVIDVLETRVCTKDNMGEYGVKGISGAEPGQDKLLNGPGLARTAGKQGVIQGGGQWPNRLGKRCLEIIGEVGEDVIYDMYVQSSESDHREVENPEEEYAVMFSRLCHEGVHEGSTGDCGSGKKGKSKKAKKKKDGAKKKKKTSKKKNKQDEL